MSTMIMQPSTTRGSSPESDPKKAKGKRQSKPKVKTGCSNCKQRRIKCDEARPMCNNCFKSKRVCAGYPAPPRRANHIEQPLAPKPPSGPTIAAAPALRPAPHAALAAAAPSTPSQTQLVPRRAHKQQVRVIHGLVSPITPAASSRPLSVAQISLPHVSQAMATPSLQMQLQHNPYQLLYQPTTRQLNDSDMMYFQLFRMSTANELSGYFDAGFWTKSVLQGAEIEPAIRHAVVALGALYKTLEKSSESPPASPSSANLRDTPSHHWNMAINQYAHACAEMRRVKEVERQSMRTQLMANVLLACFDSFVGDHKQAIMQIKNGLQLLEQLRYSHRNGFLPSAQEAIDEDLFRMFTRLAIQAKTYDMAFHFPEPHVVRLVPQTSNSQAPPSPLSDPEPSSPDVSGNGTPRPFTNLVQARIEWDRLVYKIFRFFEVMFQSNNGHMGLLPHDIRRYGESFTKQFQDWSVSFAPLFQNRHSEENSPQVRAGMATLRMHYVMSYLLFIMTFEHSELTFDRHTQSFQEMINLALEVVGDQERRAAEAKGCNPDSCMHKHFKMDIFGKCHSDLLTYHIKPSFNADMGIVQPLYVVATKCRDATIRRQAIQLLRNSARREAMWDSELCSRIGEWIVHIEEDGDDYSAASPGAQQHQRQQQQQHYHHLPNGQLSLPMQNELGQRLSMSSTASGSQSSEFGDALGPGGNGSWNWNLPKREGLLACPPALVREEKRVLVSAVEMDLRVRQATIRCGTRGIKKGQFDDRAQETNLCW